MSDKICCKCEGRNIFIVDSGLTSYRPCPCDCHKQEKVSDETELDLEAYKFWMEKATDPFEFYDTRKAIKELIKEVERLRDDLKLQEQDNERIIQCSKAAVEAIKLKNASLLKIQDRQAKRIKELEELESDRCPDCSYECHCN